MLFCLDNRGPLIDLCDIHLVEDRRREGDRARRVQTDVSTRHPEQLYLTDEPHQQLHADVKRKKEKRKRKDKENIIENNK